jgi:hypothetical protein
MARSSRDVHRRRPLASREARGYGPAHRAERKRRLARWRPGDPCARCGQPMWQLQRWSGGRLIEAIHLGHTADRTGWTGLEHDHCNESEAATRGNRRRRQRRTSANATPAPLRTSRQW